MKRLTTTLLLSALTLTGYCQNKLTDHIQYLEGVWIAEDYLKSFDKTISSINSKAAFDCDFPVGLRINKLELTDTFLNIGYSTLHDHQFHPEVSKYVTIGANTISEQGHFDVSLTPSKASNLYEISEIYYFNDDSTKAYFSWTISPDTAVILFRPATADLEEKTIRFKRISRSFKPNYLFPNPLYYYTRSRALVGDYTLRDSSNNIIATNFHIDFDGKSSGYLPFQDKIFYFSTDVYCGPPISEDFIVLYTYDEKLKSSRTSFIYKRIDEKTILFYKTKSQIAPEGYRNRIKGKMMYELTRK